MELKVTAELRMVWKQTLAQLSGAARRMFMASVVKGLGRGGARQAQLQLGWDRTTLRKGLHELNSGIVCVDAVSQRGRKPLEASLSNLEADLRAMGEATSQTDPTFRTTQLYRRLTAGEARRRLVEEKGYAPRGGALGTESAAQTQCAGVQTAAGGQEQALAQSAADRCDL